jgi:hypothetical protein
MTQGRKNKEILSKYGREWEEGGLFYLMRESALLFL